MKYPKATCRLIAGALLGSALLAGCHNNDDNAGAPPANTPNAVEFSTFTIALFAKDENSDPVPVDGVLFAFDSNNDPTAFDGLLM